ncbi:hypothetical protein N6H05_02675 [Sphingobium sp. WTD-1]|nr:hypothetical protein [Sphingobium sp. WTD-1]WIA56743.1 hypothetical protein N6H05_02675 [Sphingobium sp. WTD-1]
MIDHYFREIMTQSKFFRILRYDLCLPASWKGGMRRKIVITPEQFG